MKDWRAGLNWIVSTPRERPAHPRSAHVARNHSSTSTSAVRDLRVRVAERHFLIVRAGTGIELGAECSLEVPWPTWPLAGQAGLWQNAWVGSMGSSAQVSIDSRYL